MALLDEIQRKRVAYHESAHAVLAVAQRFSLVNTFLTRGTTTDRSIGGFTDWWATNPANRDEIALAEAKAHVLYAGEYAERHLAAVDRSVRVPAHDANWDSDESQAAEALALVLQNNPHADTRIRRETAQLVRTYWRAIANVAWELSAAHPNPAAQVVTGRGVGLVPESRIIPSGEVLRYFGEDRIAAIAFSRFEARGSANGSALNDWLESQNEVALEYPDVVEHWITDDNPNGSPMSARFRFDFPADAQRAANNLSMFNISVRLDDSVLTVHIAEPLQVGLVINRTQSNGGSYIRQHCGLFLR